MIRSISALILLSVCGLAKAGDVEDNIRDSANVQPTNPRTLCSDAKPRFGPLHDANPTITKAIGIPVDLVSKVAGIAAGSQAPDLQKCGS